MKCNVSSLQKNKILKKTSFSWENLIQYHCFLKSRRWCFCPFSCTKANRTHKFQRILSHGWISVQLSYRTWQLSPFLFPKSSKILGWWLMIVFPFADWHAKDKKSGQLFPPSFYKLYSDFFFLKKAYSNLISWHPSRACSSHAEEK